MDIHVSNELLKNGLNYLLDKQLGIILINGTQNYGREMFDQDGVLGFSMSGGTWADIKLDSNNIADDNNFSTLTFPKIDYMDTYIEIPNDTTGMDAVAQYFAVVELVNSGGEPTLIADDVVIDDADKILFVFALSQHLTLNDGSRFSFDSLTLTAGISE
ncbi:MAG: hypothetical protein LBF97_03000 [Elusimicrobiota bacterium]|jgi:hypothetical protein|nr:hypothetical protein [Elusimicrobiota bacterium]